MSAQTMISENDFDFRDDMDHFLEEYLECCEFDNEEDSRCDATRAEVLNMLHRQGIM